MNQLTVKDDCPVRLVMGILPEFTREGILINEGILVLIKRGCVHLRINFHTVCQTPDTVTVLYPGDTVMVTEWSVDAEVVSVVYSKELAREVFARVEGMRLRALQLGRCISSQLLVEMMESLMCIAKRAVDTIPWPDVYKVMYHQLCGFFVIYQVQLAQQGIGVSPSRSRTEELFTRFIRLLSEHAERTRQVSYYADALHITQRHLASVVFKHTGKSAKATIDEYVVMRMRHYLLYADSTIAELAWQFHFASPSHFCEYFKRLTSTSPQAYRVSRQQSLL